MARKRARTATASVRPPDKNERPLTLREFLNHLLPDVVSRVDPPSWPPDVFALVASVLQKSGAYIRVLTDWPPAVSPGHLHDPNAWVDEMSHLGDQWRAVAEKYSPAPEQIRHWWQEAMSTAHLELPLMQVGGNIALSHTLLQLLVAADQASRGIGIPDAKEELDLLEVRAALILRRRKNATLCEEVDPSRAVVMPKLHTPQVGLTIRSLSHNLALCPAGDMAAAWRKVTQRTVDQQKLNLLLVPWPTQVFPSQFEPIDPAKDSFRNLPPNYGCFAYNVDRESDPTAMILDALRVAKQQVGPIDGVVLPECAITREVYEELRARILKERAFLICGAMSPGAKGEEARNEVLFDIPSYGVTSQPSPIRLSQEKHHKWCLDRRQVVQYGLGGRLDPTRLWWEHIKLDRRSLNFVALQPWLTISVLICEDLARQDPVGDYVRAIGPNLVVALLMDGPQLGHRWPARYATVLADDPGSSVLTLTSLGMAQLSRAPDGENRSRVVGLWREPKAGTVQLELPEGADALVLSIAGEYLQEWTADGRHDKKSTGYPILGGVHPIKRENAPV